MVRFHADIITAITFPVFLCALNWNIIFAPLLVAWQLTEATQFGPGTAICSASSDHLSRSDSNHIWGEGDEKQPAYIPQYVCHKSKRAANSRWMSLLGVKRNKAQINLTFRLVMVTKATTVAWKGNGSARQVLQSGSTVLFFFFCQCVLPSD